MGEGGVMVFDPQLRAKISEWVIVELFPIIWNQNSRDPIPTDDVPPDEAPHVLLCDGGQGFNFYLFCEVVYAYYKELHLSYHYWEWSYDV